MTVPIARQIECVERELKLRATLVRVPLSPTQTLIVEERDLWIFGYWKWTLHKGRRTHYLYRQETVNGKGRSIWFHREVISSPPGLIVDHINGDGLDNRRSNLRLATRIENNWNRPFSRRPGKYVGVSLHQRSRLWCARLRDRDNAQSCSYHKTQEEAARAYDEKAIALRGEFATLNFPTNIDDSAAMEAVLQTLQSIAAEQRLL